MERKLYFMANRYERKRQRKQLWKKIVQFLACVVVFCTTYALILPAITLEKQCDVEEHVHTESCYVQIAMQQDTELSCTYESLSVHTHTQDCYDTEYQIVCGLANYLVHEHDASCQNEAGELVCQLPEVEVHEHSEECYRAIEAEPAELHIHEDACYEIQRSGLVCQLSEKEDHLHTDSCYEQDLVLVCELSDAIPTDEAATSESAETELICGKEVIKIHSHENDCYETYIDENGAEQKTLICTETVVGEHIHSESCFTSTEVPVDTETLTCTEAEAHAHADGCYNEAGELVCTESTEGHIHSAMCYGTWVLVCGKGAHIHTEECTVEPVPVYYCGLEEHTHGEECMDAEGNLTCTLEDHAHAEECTVESAPVYYCGQEAHTHDDSCMDESGALVCGMDEHIHSEDCLAKTEQTEILLVRPLVCTLEEHTHNTGLCFGEDEEAGSICGLEEHTHTDECYGTAVATFSYEDDHISMEVTVTSQAGLPEEMRMEVVLLNAEDKLYSAYEGYAMDNSSGELIGLTGYQIRFFCQEQEIQLVDTEITAELTVKPSEHQKSEESDRLETCAYSITNTIADFFTAERTFTAPMLMTAAAGEDAAFTGSEEETGGEPEAILTTVLQQNDDAVVSIGSASFSNTETENSRITLSLSGSNTFALADQVLNNPAFTVQYYANFPKMQYEEEEPDNATYYLDVIDTSTDGLGNGGSLPVNGAGSSSPGTEHGVVYLQLRQLHEDEQDAANQMHADRGDTAVGRNVFEVMTLLEQTQVYSNLSDTYSSGMGIENIDKLQVNSNYTLVDLWIRNAEDVAEDGTEQWTVYTTAAINKDYADSDASLLTVAEGVTATAHRYQGMYGEWYLGSNVGVNDDQWYRKYRQHADEELTYPMTVDNGVVTHVVKVASIEDLKFTNNPDNTDPNTVSIQEGDIIRLVYDLSRDDQYMLANFYDYDISDTNVYVSATDVTDNPRPELETDYIYKDINQAIYELNDFDWEPYTTFNDIFYMKTSDTVDGVNIAYGINSAESYYNTEGSAYFAFGNQNTGVFRRYDQITDSNSVTSYINGGNSNNFKGCSFGLVKDLNNGILDFNDSIAHQALFNEEAYDSTISAPEGKTPYYNQQLVFRRMGDTYILTGVNGQANDSLLNQFIAPKTAWKENETDPDVILFTNNFWPLDGVITNITEGHDMKFGNLNEEDGTASDRQYWGVSLTDSTHTGETGYGDFPSSDDGMEHNSYFGMNYGVEFQLDGDYCGPLEYLFYGDDDMWVFLTNETTGKSQLICDIGGVHGSVGSFTDLWDYIPKGESGAGSYRLDFFYTERGATGSSCYMAFTLPNMAAIPQNMPETGSVSVTKDVPNVEGSDEIFFFRINLQDADGKTLYDTFPYEIVEADGNLDPGTDFTIENDGTFFLEDGESIEIWGIPQGTEYTITELPCKLNCNMTAHTHAASCYNASDALTCGLEEHLHSVEDCTEEDEGKYNVSWTGYATSNTASVSGTVQSNTTHAYACVNEALGSLQVRKKVAGIPEEDIDTNTVYTVDVTLKDANGAALSGTYSGYQVDANGDKVSETDTTYELDQDGTATIALNHGQTVRINGIPAATRFTIQERQADGYAVCYKMEGQLLTDASGSVASSATGTIGFDTIVSIEVVNTTGYELPETGGMGATVYTTSGLLLATAVLFALMYSNKRRRGAI